MKKVALLYGPQGGYTEKVAQMIAQEYGESVVLFQVKEVTPEDLEAYDHFIFGGPTVGKHTWSGIEHKNDWDIFLARMDEYVWEGKRCAIFGLGDQVGYAHHFVDDIGTIANRLMEAGAQLVGKVSSEGYDFQDSKAFVNGQFLGLPIDEDNEPEKTLPRIQNWVMQLKKEME